jgi:hypothetical protein
VLNATDGGESAVGRGLEEVSCQKLLNLRKVGLQRRGKVGIINPRIAILEHSGELIDGSGIDRHAVEGLTEESLRMEVDPVRVRIVIISDLVAKREAGNTVKEPNTGLAIKDQVALLMSNRISISVLLVVRWLSSITLLG